MNHSVNREVIRALLKAYPGITNEELAEKSGLSIEDVTEHAAILTECGND